MILSDKKEIPWLKMNEWETLKDQHGISLQTKKKGGVGSLLKRRGIFRIIDKTHVLAKSDNRADADKDWNTLIAERQNTTGSRARSFSNSMQHEKPPLKGAPASASVALPTTLDPASIVRAVPEPVARPALENLTLEDVLTPGDHANKYVDHKFIGEGAAAAIYLAKDTTDGKAVAIKKISRKCGKLVNSVKWLIGEIHVLRNLYHHPNIVNFYDAFASGDEVWVVMEFMDLGCMTELLDKYAVVQMRESHISFVCKELLRALTFIHDNGYIHRDIKSDNVLLGKGARVKLADFGFSAQLNSKNDKRSTLVGTPYWMPPELIRGQPYDQKADVWSLGILIMELAEGQPPYIEYESMRALHIISTRGAPPLKEQNRWSYDMKQFLEACLTMDPGARARAHLLMQHPFLINACSRGEFDNFVMEANRLCPSNN